MVLGLTQALFICLHHCSAGRKQLILVLGKLSPALPGISKGVSCVLAYLSRGLSVSRVVWSRHISGEPEVLPGFSHTWVSEMSESNVTLKSIHVKCFALARAIRNFLFISGASHCQQRYRGVGLFSVTPQALSLNLHSLAHPSTDSSLLLYSRIWSFISCTHHTWSFISSDLLTAGLQHRWGGSPVLVLLDLDRWATGHGAIRPLAHFFFYSPWAKD